MPGTQPEPGTIAAVAGSQVRALLLHRSLYLRRAAQELRLGALAPRGYGPLLQAWARELETRADALDELAGAGLLRSA
jgi:hypothetical protein